MLSEKDIEAIALILREHKAEIMHEMSVTIENTFGPRLQTIIDELRDLKRRVIALEERK